MFLDLLSQAEGQLAEALAHNNVADLKEHAHGMAGAALYCGAPALHAAAKRLEHHVIEDDREHNNALVQGLSEQIARFRAAVSAQEG